jgi:TonB family protein
VRDDAKRDEERKRFFEGPDYPAAMLRMRPPLPESVCPVVLSKETYKPTYPKALNFTGMIGTIILKVDVDASGKGYNPRVVAAVPAKEFADAALKAAPKMSFDALQAAPPGCTMAQKDKVITVSFTVP